MNLLINLSLLLRAVPCSMYETHAADACLVNAQTQACGSQVHAAENHSFSGAL